jgi:hypothetical protein
MVEIPGFRFRKQMGAGWIRQIVIDADMMHASICRTDAAAVQTTDIAYVLGALETRTYDPVGNLRSADDPIYGSAGRSR